MTPLRSTGPASGTEEAHAFIRPLAQPHKETPTTDATDIEQPRPPRGNSLAFALGQFSAEIRNHTKQLDQLPTQVVEMLSPRFVALETAKADHETRIKALERWRWLVVGGGTVVAGIIGVITRVH